MITIFLGILIKKLDGYLIVKNQDEKKIGLKRLRIVDIFVKDDSNNIIDNLLYFALKFSKDNNYHIIEMIGFPVLLEKDLNSIHFLDYYQAGRFFLEQKMKY